MFRKTYALLALGLFFIELFIALYVRDQFVRPYVGDFLVVILIYCTIRAFVRIGVVKAAIATLVFAYMVEGAQALHIVELLGLGGSEIARTIVGTSFDWHDIAAYTAGVATILLSERISKALRKP